MSHFEWLNVLHPSSPPCLFDVNGKLFIMFFNFVFVFLHKMMLGVAMTCPSSLFVVSDELQTYHHVLILCLFFVFGRRSSGNGECCLQILQHYWVFKKIVPHSIIVVTLNSTTLFLCFKVRRVHLTLFFNK